MLKCKIYSMNSLIDEKEFYTDDIKFALSVANNFESELYIYSYKQDCWYSYYTYKTCPELFNK